MKLKQKIGVAAIFCLGFLVVIASSECLYSGYIPDLSLIRPVIRAYYSKRNETMLTCTVSMIETAVAIIATCLPRTSPLSRTPNHPPTNHSVSSPPNRHPRPQLDRRKQLRLPTLRALLRRPPPIPANTPKPHHNQHHRRHPAQGQRL